MPRIRLLDKHVSELIAAGEVVERPASVIKELVENSIDAGAKKITVEIQNGGVTYLRVTDDGCGIKKEDVPTAFIRHATSKIVAQEDLDAIATLGFRGEALPSIASVARVEMLTKTAEEEYGTQYVMDGGEEIGFDDAGCPVGTTIIVRDLFFNTPARLKFLKRDATEALQVSAVVDRLALSHPEISIRYLRDSRPVYQTPGDGNLETVIRLVCGKEISQGMIPVDYEYQGMRITGMIGAPENARKNRNFQNFFINGRYVRTKTGAAALEQAYKNRIMVGKFPYAMLYLTMDCSTIDVNVHPTKTEVRFANEQPIFYLVYYGVLSALEGTQIKRAQPTQQSLHFHQEQPVAVQYRFSDVTKSTPQNFSATSIFSTPDRSSQKEPTVEDLNHQRPGFLNFSVPSADFLTEKESPVKEKPILREDKRSEELLAEKSAREMSAEQSDDLDFVVEKEGSKADTTALQQDSEKDEPIHVLGELFHTYIVCQRADDVIFIDKHAAHERLIFDSLKKQEEQEQQILLTPVSVSLSGEEHAALLEHLDQVNAAGFEIEEFGFNALLVRSAPVYIQAGEIQSTLEEIAGALLEHKKDVLTEKLDWIYHSMSCRAAIKGGDRSSLEELQYLANRVLLEKDIVCCPHGRPVCSYMTRRQLEKMFGRIQ